MAKFLVAYRLKDDSTYDDRYQALIDALDDAGSGFWTTGTSLYAMETPLGIGQLGQKLKAAISAVNDFILIREIDVKNTAYIGNPGDGFLYFFPEAKKL